MGGDGEGVDNFFVAILPFGPAPVIEILLALGRKI